MMQNLSITYIKKKMAQCVYIIGIFLLLAGCTSTDNKVVEEETYDMPEKGSFLKGTLYYNDYKIDIQGPKTGHPSGEALWATYYTESDGTDVTVDIYGRDGSLEDRIKELENEGKEVAEGVLWENKCYFYFDEATIAMIPLGENAYLQVELISDDGTIRECTRVPATFTLNIEKKITER